jgi:hypothetical protein
MRCHARMALAVCTRGSCVTLPPDLGITRRLRPRGYLTITCCDVLRTPDSISRQRIVKLASSGVSVQAAGQWYRALNPCQAYYGFLMWSSQLLRRYSKRMIRQRSEHHGRDHGKGAVKCRRMQSPRGPSGKGTRIQMQTGFRRYLAHGRSPT